MRRCILAALPVLFLFGTLPAVRGNEAAPPPPLPAQKVKLVVEVDEKVKEPRLIIPKNLLVPGKKAAGLNVPTIVAGVALTLGVVSLGFWFIRKGPGRTIAAAVVVVSLFAFGVSALYANAGPAPRTPTPIKLPADLQLPEDVVLEIAEKGDTIKLIVNKATPVNVEK